MGISVDYYTNYEKEDALEKYNKFIEQYKEKIDCLIRKAFEIEGFNLPNVYIGIGVVTENEIQDINNEFRSIDKPTDVLSFPIFSREELEKIKQENAEEEMSLGDIVLCMDVIEAHSVEYGTGFNREMLYMIVHGICHLLGYDHEVEDDKKEMRALEEKILEGCN
ncbi:MAG: rRNA maturation RNase YbeY [Clostridia bacterium]|nr:rRNA maturation RNase YbeY [Clostridia bacterium]